LRGINNRIIKNVVAIYIGRRNGYTLKHLGYFLFFPFLPYVGGEILVVYDRLGKRTDFEGPDPSPSLDVTPSDPGTVGDNKPFAGLLEVSGMILGFIPNFASGYVVNRIQTAA
jgi:hypothetical protein